MRRARLAVLLLAVAGHAQEAPRSILPDVFNQPAGPPATPIAPSAPPAPAPPGSAGSPEVQESAGPVVSATPGPEPAITPPGDVPAPVDPLAAPPTSPPITDLGWLDQTTGGYPEPFAGSNGPFTAALLRRLPGPPAYRWAQIVLTRALLSRGTPPAAIDPADWAAARAWALLGMGDAGGAKALVDRAPVDRQTPRLTLVAGQAALAAGDVPALCPMRERGRAVSNDPLWTLTSAMCAGFEGDDGTQAALLDQVRDDDTAPGFDLGLAERIASVAGGANRASNPVWDEAGAMTAYRLGLASAVRLPIPDAKLADLGPVERGWLFRSAALPLTQRLAMAPAAARVGVASAEEWNALAAAEGGATAAALRSAWVGDAADRAAAMRALWRHGDGDERFAAHILTAPALTRLQPSGGLQDDAGDIVASLLIAGSVEGAAAWAHQADPAGGRSAARAWALLAVGAPAGTVPVSADRIATWAATFDGDEAPRRRALLTAGLAGLGRPGAPATPAEPATDWSRALDAAAAGHRLGEVATLAAIGLGPAPGAVSPGTLRRIVAAYAACGREREAGLLAAEALMR